MYNSNLIHKLLDKIPLAVYLTNKQCKIIFFNKASEILSGYTRQEVVGKSMIDLPKIFRSQIDAAPVSLSTKIEQLIRGKTDFTQAIFHCQRKNGSSYHIEANYCSLKNQGNKIQGILVYTRDISHQIDTLRLQKIFPYIFDSMRQSCVIVDKSGKITHFNRATEKITNISRDEAIGKIPRDILPIPKLVNGYSLDNNMEVRPEGVLKTKQPLVDIAVTTCCDGQTKELLMDTYPILDENQEIMGAINFAKDITLFRTMERELQKQEKLALIGQLAAATAHETRNPLTVAMGFLQFLEQGIEKGLPKEKQLSYVQVVKEELQLINKVTEEFLWLGKEKKDEMSKLNLNDLINNLRPILENKVLSSEVVLELELAPSLPEVTGYPKQLKQVFLNLAQNSFQVLKPKEGRLKIRTSHLTKDDQVLISFADNGPGIQPEVLAKIFDPFFTTNETGNGLGLFICKRIVEKHYGEIRVESSPEGGAEFIVTLPTCP